MKKTDITELLKNITAAPEYAPRQIKMLLNSLGLTEKGLALLLNVQPLTVKLWVNGVSVPCSVSRRMLGLLEQNPQVIELIATGRQTE